VSSRGTSKGPAGQGRRSVGSGVTGLGLKCGHGDLAGPAAALAGSAQQGRAGIPQCKYAVFKDLSDPADACRQVRSRA